MIRPFKHSDKKRIVEIFKLNTPHFFGVEELSELEKYLDKFPETYYVIYDGEIVAGGFACEFKEEDKSGRINWIFIHPDHKEKGLGKAAVNYCFNMFRSMKEIELLIVRTSQYAWKFFANFGYRLIETKENYWVQGIDLYLMKMSAADLASIETWNSVAEKYRDKFDQLKIYNESYDSFLNLVPANSEVFEAGCGPGTITRYIVERRSDLKLTASDISSEMIKLAKARLSTPDFILLDCRDISRIKANYQALICGFCLPYLNKTETEKFISDAEKLLSENGVLYISFIEGNPEKSSVQKSSDGQNELFVNYYTTNMIVDFLKKNNFKIVQTFEVFYTSDQHSIIIASKLL